MNQLTYSTTTGELRNTYRNMYLWLQHNTFLCHTIRNAMVEESGGRFRTSDIEYIDVIAVFQKQFPSIIGTGPVYRSSILEDFVVFPTTGFTVNKLRERVLDMICEQYGYDCPLIFTASLYVQNA